MKKILVVNNDIDTMSLLQKWLEKKSYVVQYTSSGEDVPVLIKKFEPALVIVDVLQKQVIVEIKTHSKTRNTPIILMTGYTLRQEPLQVYVEDVIEKPFDLSLFEKKIEKLLS